ncbi:chitinase CLP-like [Triticum aestivum]|uniref:chitinase CLP-like n=1 Tax=Triticum aestivum TaxID=4565 RepID=UPI001D005B80|nr:chitinase CLP-like [Triticum aestivum]
MARLLLILAASLVALAWPASCQRLPVLAPVTKDLATSLYTLPFHDGANLVVDIAGPLVWSTCQRDHLPAELPCKSPTCRLANAYPVPGCHAPGCGRDWHGDRTCTVYPYNPVTGACAAGNLVHTRFVANTTDGRNPVSQVNVRAVAACAPRKLLASLPRGSTGVAGLAGSGLALPAQSMDHTPLVTKQGSPAHYISVKSISMDNTRVLVSERALATGGVMLSTRVPYALLRRDVYRPFVDAFVKALAAQAAPGGPVARAVRPVAPFELCYDAQTLGNTRFGYWVPSVTLALDGGRDWRMAGVNSMVDVEPGTACLAFVEMKGVKAGDGRAPAVIVGGLQMENIVLEFDMEKKRLGLRTMPYYMQCSHFNFTRSA